MNNNVFFQQIKEKFSEEFVFFFCRELQIVLPSVLIALTMKQIKDLARSTYPDLVKSSIKYYTDNHELKSSVILLIQLLKKKYINSERKKRKSISFN